MYGVIHEVAIDGCSHFADAASKLPIKNNIVYYGQIDENDFGVVVGFTRCREQN